MQPKIGEKAPDFTATDQNGNPVQLSTYKGKKVALYFYPKDDTPGCTTQACNLRDNYQTLENAGFEVIGVSADNEKSHQKFIKKYDLPFTLIADKDKTVNEKYGVWVEKSMFGRKYMGTARTTFIINEKGVITDIISKVKTDDHTRQILG